MRTCAIIHPLHLELETAQSKQPPQPRQPVHEKFKTVPCPWNGPALYVTPNGTGKRRKGRIVKGMGALQGGPG